MGEKRRDNRGRVLHNGESQRQDGRYAYKYKDLNGEIKFVYSWRLDKNDRTPAGKVGDLSPREKERQIQQDLIRKNPFQFELAAVVVNDSLTRESISRAQERAFLSFIQNDAYYCKYYDGIFILFNTGLRVSEFCGLTIGDIDFKKKRIRVDHQLQYTHAMEYTIEDTKTKNGERFVPMSPQVAACFRRIIENRKKPRQEPMIDGYTGFLFLEKMRCRWLPFTGRSTLSISGRSTTVFIKFSFRKSRLMCADIPSAPIWQRTA